jgi:tetratricopeptide (TPR) repeat protein
MNNNPHIENSQAVIAGVGQLDVGRDFTQIGVQNINQHDPSAVWKQKYPNTNPYPKPNFFADSREDELADVHTRLQGESCLVLVNGTGGIGKTSIAAAFCADHAEEFDHIVWVHCENTIRNALIRSPLFGRLFPPGHFAPGTPEDVIFEQILAQLASAPGRNLLVLDNANDGADLIATRTRLESLRGWSVLLTSRADRTGLPERKIGTLTPERARNLFCKYFPPASEQTELLDRLLGAIGRHTLLTECLAKHLADRLEKGKTASLQNLCDGLTATGALTLPRAGSVKVDWHNHPEVSPDALLDALFSLSELDSEAQGLLLRLSLLPAEPQSLTKVLYPLFSVTDEAAETAFDARLDALARSGWLEFFTGKGYRVHPLAGEALRRKLPHGYEDCDDLVERLIALLGSKEVHLDRRLELCEAARSVAGQIAGAANGRVAALLFYLFDSEFAAGNFTDTERLMTEAALIFEAARDMQNHSVSLTRLGTYFQDIGNFERALEFFEKNNRLKEGFYAANPNDEEMKHGLAISYERLGDLWRLRGDLDRALEFFKKRCTIAEELYVASPSERLKYGLAISYDKLGDLWHKLGDFDRALEFFEKYNHFTEELCAANPRNEDLKDGLAVSYGRFGELWQKRGDFDHALEFFKKYNQLSEELYAANPRNERLKNALAISYYKLAGIYEHQGDLEKAFDFYGKDLKLTEEAFLNNPRSAQLREYMGISFRKMGRILEKMGRHSEAAGWLEKAKELE